MYFARMYSHVLACTRMLLVGTRMYSYVLACTRMLLVCYPWVLACTRTIFKDDEKTSLRGSHCVDLTATDAYKAMHPPKPWKPVKASSARKVQQW